MKKNVILYIIVATLIINFIIFIYLISHKSNEDNFQMSGNTKTNVTSIEFDHKIRPEQYQKFEKEYKGNVEPEYIYGKIYNLITNLYKIYDDVNGIDKQEIAKYYKQNERKIANTYGIATENDYNNLLDELNSLFANEKRYYSSVKLLMDTYTEKEDYIECEMLVEFNNEKELKFNMVVVKNSENSKLSVIFIPKIEE